MVVSFRLIFFSLLLSCSEDQSANLDAGREGTRRLEVVRSLSHEVILPKVGEFSQAASVLEEAAREYSAERSDERKLAVQNAWQDAMNLWQELEVMQVGPAGAMDTTIGGEDLRDEIYSWPLVNRCRVDQELVEAAYRDVDAFAAENVNCAGLGCP